MDFLRIDNGDLKDRFLSAWEIAFQRKLDKAVYDWAFNSKNKVFGVLDNDIIVAGYCLMEFNAVCNSTYRKGLLCNNVFVNGFQYHKLGLFSKLTEFSFEKVLEDSYDFAIGFPNEKAIKAHIRSGWQEAPKVHVLELSPDYFKDEYSSSLSATIEWYSSKESVLQGKLGEIETLCNLCSTTYNYSSLRNADYLSWRYIDNPRYSYDFCFIYDADRVLNCICISKYYPANNKVHLVDFIFQNTSCMGLLIKAIINKYSHYEIGTIDCWASKFDTDAFISVGFKDSNKFTYCIGRGIRDKGFKIDLSSHLVLGDNDVY